MNKGKALWDIKKVKASWQEPCHELAFATKDQRILPEEFQCRDLRRLNHVLIIQEHFLSAEMLAGIQQKIQILSLVKSWSVRLQHNLQAGQFEKSSRRPKVANISSEDSEAIENDMLGIVNQFWKAYSKLLITRPNEISHIQAWINTGPLADGQAGRYHFTHYDCDEYLEFSKGLYRFPAYAVVFYITIPKDCEGGAIWFPEIKQGVLPNTNLLAIFDARLAHAVLPVVAPVREPRIVMVMNLWDYETRDEHYELTNGILGYTENRRDELQWLP